MSDDDDKVVSFDAEKQKRKPGRPPKPKPKRKLPPRNATFDDFYAYLPERKFIFTPTRGLWPPTTINSILGDGSATALDIAKPIHAMTWCPGRPMIVANELFVQGGWTRALGTHKVQHPETKINHALVLGSHAQGIGKDSLLQPVKLAVGPWNMCDIGAKQSLDPSFNAFLQSVILRISEAHDLGERRFGYYDHVKDWCAGPPETLRVADKHIRAFHIANLVGPIFTTNHRTDGLYFPAWDRRNYVAWSDADPMTAAEVTALQSWYADDGGLGHVAKHLATLDLSGFLPGAEPKKTDAWWTMVNLSAQEGELADVLDVLGVDTFDDEDTVEPPPAVTIGRLLWAANRIGSDLSAILADKTKGRVMLHKLDVAGYVPVRKLDDKQGMWRIGGKRTNVYARASLSVPDRDLAAKALAKRENARADRARAARHTRGDYSPD